MNIRERVGVFIDLYDVILVDAVDRAVRAAADLLTALDRNDAVRLFDLHQFGKASHVEDLIDVGMDVCDRQIGIGFFDPQQHAKTCA